MFASTNKPVRPMYSIFFARFASLSARKNENGTIMFRVMAKSFSSRRKPPTPWPCFAIPWTARRKWTPSQSVMNVRNLPSVSTDVAIARYATNVMTMYFAACSAT